MEIEQSLVRPTETSRRPRLGRYAALAGALFAGQAIWAGVHLATGGRYRGLEHPADIVIDVSLVVIWTFAAFAMFARRELLVYFALFGAVTTLAQGLLACIWTPFSGVPFLVAGVIVSYTVLRALPLFGRAPEPAPVSVPERPFSAPLLPHR